MAIVRYVHREATQENIEKTSQLLWKSMLCAHEDRLYESEVQRRIPRGAKNAQRVKITKEPTSTLGLDSDGRGDTESVWRRRFGKKKTQAGIPEGDPILFLHIHLLFPLQ